MLSETRGGSTRWPALAALVLVAAVGLAAAPARALPFTGSFVLRIDGLGIPPLTISGSGTGDPTLPSISVDAFVGSASAGVIFPPFTQVFLDLDGNAAGTIGTGPSFFDGSFTTAFGPKTGNLFVVGFGGQFGQITLPFAGHLGFPGATTMLHSLASATATASFGAWTTGVATIVRSHTGMTAPCVAGGVICPTAMLGGATANASSFGGAAQVVLVAPINVWSSIAFQGFPTFAVLGLNYVPEPGALLLLVSGGAALALAGSRRRG